MSNPDYPRNGRANHNNAMTIPLWTVFLAVEYSQAVPARVLRGIQGAIRMQDQLPRLIHLRLSAGDARADGDAKFFAARFK